jgi:Mce-associated membrane protein
MSPVTLDAGGTTTQGSGPTTERWLEDIDGPPPDLTARWLRRVVAALLDSALLSAITFLASPVLPVSSPSYLPANPVSSTPLGPSWTENGIVVGSLLLLVVMQAYLGVTPGKLAAGIAVVRISDGRPAGFLRTALRLLLHILDSVLLIGYLRPLWHRRRQTFADSIVMTVVLVTRRPQPWAPPGGDPRPVVWEAPAEPPWMRTATPVATVACIVGVLFSSSMSGTTGATRAESCTPAPQPDASFRIVEGTVFVDPGTMIERRLGVVRERITGNPEVRVEWLFDGTLPDGPVLLTATFTSADDARSIVVDSVLEGGVVTPEAGVDALPEGQTGIALRPEALASLGDDWTWALTATVRGEAPVVCRARRFTPPAPGR